MDVHSDYEDLFKVLNGCKIKYLVIGAYAVMYYTQPRFTKDIDIWIIPEMNSNQKTFEALRKFGAPLRKMKPEDFDDKGMIFQIGIAPVRIDILLDVPGVSFERAWKNKKRVKYGKTSIYVIGKDDLISTKKKANRPQDKMDIDNLLN